MPAISSEQRNGEDRNRGHRLPLGHDSRELRVRQRRTVVVDDRRAIRRREQRQRRDHDERPSARVTQARDPALADTVHQLRDPVQDRESHAQGHGAVQVGPQHEHREHPVDTPAPHRAPYLGRQQPQGRDKQWIREPLGANRDRRGQIEECAGDKRHQHVQILSAERARRRHRAAKRRASDQHIHHGQQLHAAEAFELIHRQLGEPLLIHPPHAVGHVREVVVLGDAVRRDLAPGDQRQPPVLAEVARDPLQADHDHSRDADDEHRPCLDPGGEPSQRPGIQHDSSRIHGHLGGVRGGGA